jgi:hypothetical protein
MGAKLFVTMSATVLRLTLSLIRCVRIERSSILALCHEDDNSPSPTTPSTIRVQPQQRLCDSAAHAPLHYLCPRRQDLQYMVYNT